MNWTPAVEKSPSKDGVYIVTMQRKDGSRFVDEDWYHTQDTIGNPQGWLTVWPATVVAWAEKPGKYKLQNRSCKATPQRASRGF